MWFPNMSLSVVLKNKIQPNELANVIGFVKSFMN